MGSGKVGKWVYGKENGKENEKENGKVNAKEKWERETRFRKK